VRQIESLVERIIWSSRLAVLVAVFACIIIALGLLFATTVDVVYMVGRFIAYGGFGLTSDARSLLRDEVITGVVKILDGYLLAAIMLIFGLGLYELFVNNIDIARDEESGPRLLRTRNLDDLKDRLAKVILLVLIVEFFQYALRLPFNTSQDLLFLAIGIALIGGAIYLTRDKTAVGKTAGADLP
jgi:uncharacterized membrane protein YqhA